MVFLYNGNRIAINESKNIINYGFISASIILVVDSSNLLGGKKQYLINNEHTFLRTSGSSGPAAGQRPPHNHHVRSHHPCDVALYDPSSAQAAERT